MTKHIYGAVLRESEDGGWWAEVPDLPGCFGQGDTFMGAVESISNGLETHLAAMAGHGMPVPEATPVATEEGEVVYIRVEANEALASGDSAHKTFNPGDAIEPTAGNGCMNTENISIDSETFSDNRVMMHPDRAGDTSQRCGHSPAVLFSDAFEDPDNAPVPLCSRELGQRILDNGFAGDAGVATFLVDRVNYRKLRQYCRVIEQSSDVEPTLENMHLLLCLDRDLASIMLKWIGVFEEHFRARVANEMSLKLGAFAHRHPENFKDPSHYASFLEAYERELEFKAKNNDDAVVNAIEAYGEPPIWTVVEMLSLGTLSKLYRNLRSKAIKHSISDSFRVEYGVFSSWLRTISEVRNRCAHFSSLICKPLVAKPKSIPRFDADNGSLFYVALMLVRLTEADSVHADLRNTYELGMIFDMVDLCRQQKNGDLLSLAGFPTDWARAIADASDAFWHLREKNENGKLVSTNRKYDRI